MSDQNQPINPPPSMSDKKLIRGIIERTIPALLILLSVFILVLLGIISPEKKNKPTTNTNSNNGNSNINTVVETTDYDLLSTLQKISVVDATPFESWTPNEKRTDDKTKLFSLTTSGKLSRAYLYIEASIGGKPLSQYESIYGKNLQESKEIPGQLLRSASLEVPKGDNTKLLYALNAVPVVNLPYSDIKTPIIRDWLSSLNNAGTHNFMFFVSSLRKAEIDKLVIYYDCETPNECSVKLQ